MLVQVLVLEVHNSTSITIIKGVLRFDEQMNRAARRCWPI